MIEVDTIKALRETVRAWRRGARVVALVPTMGNLHDGHLNLVRRAQREADRVVVSIFVNPTQFAPGEDYAAYPRTFAQDRASLEAVGADAVFAPPVEEVYPRGPEQATRVEVGGLSDILCGASRPGHFVGVATVVSMLFNMVTPDMAVFGEKDYQQLAIIRRMVRELHIPVQVLGEPTTREASGLAMSSRNRYLDEQERARAPALYRSLREAAEALSAGERDFRKLEDRGWQQLEQAGMQPDYFSVRCQGDLGAPEQATRAFVVLAAARLSRARLIDNVTVDAGSP